MFFSPLQLTAGTITALLVYIVFTLIYRLTLHPLAKYPGPFWAKVTGWYNTYHCWKKDRHLDQYRCHQKYGPVVRYGPNHVIINTVDGARTIYSGAKTNVQKAPLYKYLHNNNVAGIATIIDKTAHARKRHITSQGFSDTALRGLEPYMQANIEQWCGLLGTNPADGRIPDANEWTEAKNMSKWANYLTFDVLGDLCFGKPFGLLTSEAQRYVPQMLLSNMYAFQIIGNSPMLPVWKPIIEKLGLDRLIFPQVFSHVGAYRSFVMKVMSERIEKYKLEKESDIAERKDFFYWLTNAKGPDDGPGYNMTELTLEARTLITAGSDTSSITLAAAYFYLCRNPTVLRKLQNELRATFADFDAIRMGPKMNSCVYLRAVIDETLRTTPPVPSSLPREAQVGGITVEGEYFPEGTILGSSAYCLHHNPSNFPNAFAFQPERWIVNEELGVTSKDVAAAKLAFMPFSLGSRGCVGKPMAYAEISMALAKVLWRYDIRLKPGDRTGEASNGQFSLGDVFVCERDGPLVEFKRVQ